jgi:putative tributyrin esterase
MAAEHPTFAPQLMKVFGPDGNTTRANNDIYKLAANAQPATAPYFFLTCGTSDAFLPTNREFVVALPAQHLRYEYHEVPGAHSWEFWDHSLQEFLHHLIPRLTR